MPFSRSEKDTTMQILTNIMKWSAIPALLVISILSRFAAGYGFVADIAICIGAVVFVHWAVRAKTYFWAAGFVPVAVVFSLLTFCLCPTASAYSVLTHEAIVDSTWDSAIKPLLVKRFPAATTDDLT